MTRPRKVLSAFVVLVVAVAFWMTAFNDVKPILGGPDWSLVPWYCYDHGEPRPHLEDAAYLDHPCSQDELPISLRRH
jgi:hypothetical protein